MRTVVAAPLQLLQRVLIQHCGHARTRIMAPLPVCRRAAIIIMPMLIMFTIAVIMFICVQQTPMAVAVIVITASLLRVVYDA